MPLSEHLHALEAQSMAIFREAAAAYDKLAMMYSIGKDSSVLLHLAEKAFAPAPVPFPLLHIDTTWKFKEMIQFRDTVVREHGLTLYVYTNQDGVEQGINPFTHGSALYTDVMKTRALKDALTKYGIQAAIGGARRDEEKSRAKERIFSIRSEGFHWDARSQRPELWELYNTLLAPGETMRVFPLSNWTELDVWEYIVAEQIELVPLYFAKPRPVVQQGETLIMVDDDRYPFKPGEKTEEKWVRFRTLGCWPLTGAVESHATTLEEVLEEIRHARFSERAGRLIDSDQQGSMERKKQEGYF